MDDNLNLLSIRLYSLPINDNNFISHILTNDIDIKLKHTEMENSQNNSEYKKKLIKDIINKLIDKLKNKEFKDINALTIMYKKKNESDHHFYHYTLNKLEPTFKMYYYTSLIKLLYKIGLDTREIGNLILHLLQLYPNKITFFKQYPIAFENISEDEKKLLKTNNKISIDDYDTHVFQYHMEIMNLLDSKNPLGISFCEILLVQLIIEVEKNPNYDFYNSLNAFVIGIYSLVPALHLHFSNNSADYEKYSNLFKQIKIGEDSEQIKMSLNIIYSLAYKLLPNVRKIFDTYDVSIPNYIE